MFENNSIYKRIVVLLFLGFIHILFISYLNKFINIKTNETENLFFFDLIGKNASIPWEIIQIFSIINIILILKLGNYIFNKNYGLISALIYTINPWALYVSASGSVYIYLLTLILLLCYSTILIIEKKKFIGSVLFVLSTLLIIYSSSLFMFLPILIIAVMIIKKDLRKTLLYPLFTILLFVIVLLFTIMNYKLSFTNIFRNQVTIFSDPGIINAVNNFQGLARKNGLDTLARLSENRYIYYSEYALQKYLRNVTPVAFFTPQEKLLDFSYSPPLYFGLLIPFLWGIYKYLKTRNELEILTLSSFLVIPSVLDKNIVNLNRLIVFFPVIIFLITYGILKLTKESKNIFKYLIILVLTLVLFQFLLTLSDIKLRENERSLRYLGAISININNEI